MGLAKPFRELLGLLHTPIRTLIPLGEAPGPGLEAFLLCLKELGMRRRRREVAMEWVQQPHRCTDRVMQYLQRPSNELQQHLSRRSDMEWVQPQLLALRQAEAQAVEEQGPGVFLHKHRDRHLDSELQILLQLRLPWRTPQ
jgi:hypothetical protein